jgi:hypothetical protein
MCSPPRPSPDENANLSSLAKGPLLEWLEQVLERCAVVRLDKHISRHTGKQANVFQARQPQLGNGVHISDYCLAAVVHMHMLDAE